MNKGLGETQQHARQDKSGLGQDRRHRAAGKSRRDHLGANGLRALERAHVGELPVRQEVPQAQRQDVPDTRRPLRGAVHRRGALHGAGGQGELLEPELVLRHRFDRAQAARVRRVLQAARCRHVRSAHHSRHACQAHN